MTQSGTKNAERISRRQVDKFAERRGELAESALQTLGELGYARTSLREIAQNSAFSHGVLHYYFTDKIDLITHGVRRYKAVCVTRYDEVVENATTPRELEIGFAAALAQTLRADFAMHRLWYDLRSQALFEPALRADVAEIDASLEHMIWRVVSRYSALADAGLAVSSPVAYALFDGMFQQALLHHLDGDESAADRLDEQARTVLRTVVLQVIEAQTAGSRARSRARAKRPA